MWRALGGELACQSKYASFGGTMCGETEGLQAD
jgi:hypothetical protein